METVSFDRVSLSEGFWKQKQDLVRHTTIHSVYRQFASTGRIGAFRFCPDGPEPHVYWDSDVAKWIESVAYLTQKQREPELEAQADEIIKNLAVHQAEDGYFNLHYQQVEPRNRLSRRRDHELYCLGHFIEAAVAYETATGKDLLRRCMERYVALIYHLFVEEGSTAFETPGHEEIELALLRLYHHNGNKIALRLCRFFLDRRGRSEKDTPIMSRPYRPREYDQSHLPVREQREAVGHCVRACYLYSGMADLAREDNDEALKEACRALFEDIVNRKMYVTGGIGSLFYTESFSENYYLPTRRAYAETCAAISLALFAHRMLLLQNRRIYADTVERALYNGVLSGLSLDGTRFFYVNPLEIDRREILSLSRNGEAVPLIQRPEMFDCSCCPPNLTRLIPSVGQFVYTAGENCLYVHQFMAGTATVSVGGQTASVCQETAYPLDGRVTLTVSGYTGRLAVRVPGWSRAYTGEIAGDGYLYWEVTDKKTVTLDFQMEPYFVQADPHVTDAAGRVALCRGPLVYCLEEVDNGACLHACGVRSDAAVTETPSALFGAPILTVNGTRRPAARALYERTAARETDTALTFVPYYGFANRGESDMLVWVRALS